MRQEAEDIVRSGGFFPPMSQFVRKLRPLPLYRRPATEPLNTV